ncbi:MAG: hypothetical protein JXR58_01460, partial [Bacteroidales bacterium]|nr:hypothetical protein [Bacteroidales bacterium]
MKNAFHLIFLTIILISTNSCFVNRKHFTLHKELTFVEDNRRIKLNGGYYRIEKSRGIQEIFLYNDGIVKYNSFWGHYCVLNNKLNIQYFSTDRDRYKYDVIEMFCEIKNDTIIIWTKRCPWCKNNFVGYDNTIERHYSPPIELVFKEGEKPDSSQAWFFNK